MGANFKLYKALCSQWRAAHSSLELKAFYWLSIRIDLVKLHRNSAVYNQNSRNVPLRYGPELSEQSYNIYT